MAVVLITGFEPFGGESVNPSGQVAQALDGHVIGGARVAGRVLPCAFDDAIGALDAALDELQPSLVLALGQAAGRCEVSFERVAINLVDARIPDNRGDQPVDEPVLPGAPAALFTSLPVKAMARALREHGIPAGLSLSAGSFVCNALFFALMHRLATRRGVRGGFVHLPLLPEQAARQPGAACLPLQLMVEGVRVATETALAVHADLAVPGGTLA